MDSIQVILIVLVLMDSLYYSNSSGGTQNAWLQPLRLLLVFANPYHPLCFFAMLYLPFHHSCVLAKVSEGSKESSRQMCGHTFTNRLNVTGEGPQKTKGRHRANREQPHPTAALPAAPRAGSGAVGQVAVPSVAAGSGHRRHRNGSDLQLYDVSKLYTYHMQLYVYIYAHRETGKG